MFPSLDRIRRAKTGRTSSWDITGGNADCWRINPGQTVTLADIKGPGRITHIWMTQSGNYRQCLLRFTWDHARHPSVVVPLGDFFCLGNGIINSFESALFTASTSRDYSFEGGCALNCYAPMPFREHAKIELINQSDYVHGQYFYIDYETYDQPLPEDIGYFQAEFRRANPFGGWGHELDVNSPESNVPNKERQAWDNNYVILETHGRGHYIGCNLSVSNMHGHWWGEGDDMIWVDGYKWPPDLHGTGSEDYLNQAWGMQSNAFLRNGSSVHEKHTIPGGHGRREGGYQTSYIFHLENPVHFSRQIKVTIENGHANHLCNEICSVAYWYADKPTGVIAPPPVAQRMPVRRTAQGQWLIEKANQCPGKPVRITLQMKKAKRDWARKKKQ